MATCVRHASQFGATRLAVTLFGPAAGKGKILSESARMPEMTTATARAILGSGRPSTGMARPRAAARYAARSTFSHVLPALGAAL